MCPILPGEDVLFQGGLLALVSFLMPAWSKDSLQDISEYISSIY